MILSRAETVDRTAKMVSEIHELQQKSRKKDEELQELRADKERIIQDHKDQLIRE